MSLFKKYLCNCKKKNNQKLVQLFACKSLFVMNCYKGLRIGECLGKERNISCYGVSQTAKGCQMSYWEEFNLFPPASK